MEAASLRTVPCGGCHAQIPARAADWFCDACAPEALAICQAVYARVRTILATTERPGYGAFMRALMQARLEDMQERHPSYA